MTLYILVWLYVYLGKNFSKADFPDVWLLPEKSFIFQVKCSEIVPSSNYSSGYALRFPRFVLFREDKSFSSCMDLTELRGYIENPKKDGKKIVIL